MRSWLKEILICLLALTAMGGAIFFYYRSVQEEKTVEEVDLFSLVPGNLHTVVDFNKTAVFTRLIAEKEILQEVTGRFIPDIYLSVMKCLPEVDHFLYSSHSRGDLLYAKLSYEQLATLDNEISRSFPGYPPQKQEKYGVRFMFYADAEQGFWGYYYHRGIWVAGYSRKLLEEAALKQLSNDSVKMARWQEILEKQDKNALLNVAVKTDWSRFSIPVTDSTYYYFPGDWFGTEFFLGEETLCLFGELPDNLPCDSLRDSFVDTLSYRLNNVLYPLQFGVEITDHNQKSYFTFCTSLF